MEWLDKIPKDEQVKKLEETHFKALDMLTSAIADEREYILLVKNDKELQGPISVGGGAAIIHIANMRDVLAGIVEKNTHTDPMEKVIRMILNGKLLTMPLEELISSLGLSEEDIARADKAAQAEGGKSLAELLEMEKRIKQRIKNYKIDPKAMGLSAHWKED